MDAPRRIVLTGASRGLGLEFTRQWLAAGRRVFALAREPGASQGLQELASRQPQRCVPVACDVADPESVRAAARAVAARTEGVDLLLNNAGIYGKQQAGIEELQIERLADAFQVNALGPLRVTQAFLPLLRRGTGARVVHVTSLMGSLGDNSSGGSYAYRLSKAALNMASRNLDHDLRRDGIPSVVLHPGWVRTDMGGAGAPLPAEEAVAALISTIEALRPGAGGGFLDREGQPLPW